MTTAPQPVAGRLEGLSVLADKAVFRLAKHWLALASLLWGLYVGLPFLTPLLMNAGWTTPAKVLYFVYRPLCHQLPERSYFLTGPQYVYSAEELAAAGVRVDLLSRDIGNEAVGWKVGFCQRDVALYGSLLLAGLIYGLVRPRWKGWKMPFRYFLLFLVPIGVDGFLQLFGVHESTWILRTITGAILGVGCVLFAYPYLEEGMAEVRDSISRRRLAHKTD